VFISLRNRVAQLYPRALRIESPLFRLCPTYIVSTRTQRNTSVAQQYIYIYIYMWTTYKTPPSPVLYLQRAAQQRKSSNCCRRIRYGGNVFIESLPINGPTRHNIHYIFFVNCN
jgi:hypothetical protein